MYYVARGTWRSGLAPLKTRFLSGPVAFFGEKSRIHFPACRGNVDSGLMTLKMRFSGTGRSRGVRRDLKRDELRLGILPPAPPARVRHGSAGEILLSGPNAAYTMLGRQRRTICSCEHTTNEPGCGRLTFRSCGGTRPARSPGMRWRGLVVLALGQMMGVTVK